jgi:dGTPase
MADHGGFEHNLQSLRVVDELENKYAQFPGLNLTFETREGILKHCSLSKARELGEMGIRFIQRKQPSLEAQVSDLADEIAYNNHDIDDGLRADMISVQELCEISLFNEQYQKVIRRYPNLEKRQKIHEVVRRMINYLVVDLIETSRDAIQAAGPSGVEEVRNHPVALIRFSEEVRMANLELKRFLRNTLYRHYRVQRMAMKAKLVVSDLFELFVNDPGLLPTEYRNVALDQGRLHGDSARARVVADYIAGMTDRYAISEHRRVFDPRCVS